MTNKNKDKSKLKNVINAILFGIYTILLGYLTNFIVRPFLKVDLPEVCKSWNKHHAMEASLFLIGFILYFIKTKKDWIKFHS